MMDKHIARNLLQLVNGNLYTDLKDYAEYRVNYLRSMLESASNMEQVKVLQGQILEAKRLLSLQEEVVADVKDNE